MTNNCFTADASFRHLFFIKGLTADTFYPDNGMRTNIEWLVFLELKRSGYERIVYLDKNNMLYVYDDESFSLLAGRKNTTTGTQNLGKQGLDFFGEEETETHTESDKPNHKEGKWQKTNHDIGILNMPETPLHLGSMKFEDAFAQCDAYMHDASIKTAIVIRDYDTTFRAYESQRGIGNGMSQLANRFKQELTVGYQRLDDNNENIMVFISSDRDLGSITNVEDQTFENKDVNLVEIACPNAMEIKNMLLYFRYTKGLQFSLRDIDLLALALHQAMTLKKPQVRIKALYKYLDQFAKTQKILSEEDCYRIVGVKKPVSAKEQLDELIGMENLKERILSYDVGKKDAHEIISGYSASRLQKDPVIVSVMRKNQMIHIVLTGNPGTGKTTAAKLIGQLFYEMGYLSSGHLVETDRAGLVAEYVGQTAIKTRNKVMEALGGVLFVDEAYALSRSDTKGDFGQEAIDTLVKCMDEFKGQFILVVAGYETPMKEFLDKNEGLASRFGRNHIHLEDYTPKEMKQILSLHVRKAGYVFSDELNEKMDDFCENWVNQAAENWGNAREATNLVDTMHNLFLKDPGHTYQKINNQTFGVLEERHIPEDQLELFVPIAQSREEVLRQFHSMIGLQSVKDRIDSIRNVLLVSGGHSTKPIHYRFEGSAGTGKTTVARYMGKILRNLGMLKRGHTVEYTATTLMSEMNKGKSFEEIADKALNGVLFIDEAYQLINYATGRTALDALLPYMENHNHDICVILAGYPEDMEKLIAYNDGFQSRFDSPIVFDHYTPKELCEILLGMLKSYGYSYDSVFEENALRVLTGYIPRISKDSKFGNARYIRDAFMPSCIDAQSKRLIATYGEVNIPEEERRMLRGNDFAGNLLGYTKTKIHQDGQKSAWEELNELVGFEDVKKKLQDLINLKQKAEKFHRPDFLDDHGLDWVLKGNPGTGKTMIAKLIGKVFKEEGILPKGHVIVAKRQDLVGAVIGETEKKTQKLIDDAMGGILFIDEAYTLSSAGSTNDFGPIAINVLLEQMSDHKGEFSVICAGYPDEMDAFLSTNPGLKSRFANEIILEDYTAEELVSIFESKCKEKDFTVDEGLKPQLLQYFRNRIARKEKYFGNGRAAANLFDSMKDQWASDMYATECHLTDAYFTEEDRKYLVSSGSKRENTSKQVFADHAYSSTYPIDRNTMREPDETFHFDQKDYLKQTDAVVFVENTKKDGEGCGTGSIITRDGKILTCHHVVKDAEKLRVRLRTTQFGIETTIWKDATVVWCDEKLDAAILAMEIGNYPVIPLQPKHTQCIPGDDVYHWGYPFGDGLNDSLEDLNPTLFKGSIGSLQTKHEISRISVNMEAKSGCSGGPVFSKEHGYMVGILCGSQIKSNQSLVEELNYILPVQEIWNIIQS